MLYNIPGQLQEHESSLTVQIMPPEGYVICPPGPPRLNSAYANAQQTAPLQMYAWGDQMHYRQDRHSFSSAGGSPSHMDPHVKHEDMISPLTISEHYAGWPLTNYAFSPNPPASPPQEASVEYPYIANQRYPGDANCTLQTSGPQLHRYSNDHSAGILTPPTTTTSPFRDPDWNHFPPPETEELHLPQRSSLSRHAGPGSPVLVHRSDGVRKKNAKFEIPQERTIDNIDQMLKKTKDEEKRKELKMQKRLLKNREAALQSRQRKKQHTEHLEEEKKNLEGLMSNLEDDFSQSRSQVEELVKEKLKLEQRGSDYEHRLHELRVENERLIAAHKSETADLHKKIHNLSVLLESQSTPLSTVPSSDGNDFAHDMDNLALGNPYWDSGEFFDEVSINSDNAVAQRLSNQSYGSFKPPSTPAELHPSGERLVTMLFLYGAYMASQNSSPASAVSPGLPDDIQHASRAIMNCAMQNSNANASTTWVDGRHSPLGSLGHGQTSMYPSVDQATESDVLHNFLGRSANLSAVAEFKKLIEQSRH